jgi:hypothetical protein
MIHRLILLDYFFLDLFLFNTSSRKQGVFCDKNYCRDFWKRRRR